MMDTPDPNRWAQANINSGDFERQPIGAGELAWLALCVLAGAALRGLNMAGRPLWADEFITMITSSRPLLESFMTGQDPQPPLHQLLVRLVTSGEYPPEWAVRGPAVFFGCLAIPAAWWFARNVFGAWAAAVSVLAVAINPMLILHSRDARPYTLFVFTATMSMTFFYRLMNNGQRKDAVGYALFTALMAYSHYYAVFCGAAQVVFVAFGLAGGTMPRGRLKTVLSGVAAALALAAPICFLFIRMLLMGAPGSWWIPRPGLVQTFDTLGDLLGLRAVGVLCVIPLLATVWLAPTPFDRAAATQTSWWLRRRAAIFCSLWIGFGLVVPIVVSILYKPGFVTRYALPVAIPMTALGVYYLWSLNRAVFVLVIASLLAYNLPKAVGVIKSEPGVREAAQWLNRHAQDNAPVLVIDYPFSDDFINPEAFGLRHYGLRDRKIDGVSVKSLERHADGQQGGLLPPEKCYVVTFLSTVNPLREYLSHRGRAFKTIDFGMYKIVRINAED